MKRVGDWSPHAGAVAYACTSLGYSLMHAVFMFYYVRVFLDLYNIEESWFQWAQVIYMIWNAVNDPLFGYCQDNCNLSIVKSRRHTIMYGAPLFALSFLIPWFPWRQYVQGDILCGLQLVLALCLYDALFTYVLLAACCLFAELSQRHEDRLRMLQYSQIASLIGSTSVFFCEWQSEHLKYYGRFQFCCVVLSILAWLCMHYTGKHGHTIYDMEEVCVEDCKDSQEVTTPVPSSSERSTHHSIWALTWQIISNVNFFWYVIMNLMSEFHVNFLVSFSSIITDTVVPRAHAHPVVWSFFYGAVLMLPRVIVILANPILLRFGYYYVYKSVFLVKIASGLSMYFAGLQHTRLFMVFILIDSVLSYMAQAMIGMPLSDVIDSDMKLHKRKHPMSSMVFGTNALITKPGISLAPMLTVFILNRFGYREYKAQTLSNIDDLRNAMFTLTCFVPIVVGLIQLGVWTKYRIRDSHRTTSKYIDM